MKTHLLNRKNSIVLGMALSASSVFMSGTALAVDAIGGSATNTNVTVTSPVAWTVLGKVTFQNPTQRYCIATGSADAQNPLFQPSAAPWQYRFTVSNSPNPLINQGQERTLEFWNQVAGGSLVRDNQIKEITTTGGWMANVLVNPGYFTFPAVAAPFNGQTVYLLARKIGNVPNLTVLDSSLTVTCTDNRLIPPFGIIPLVVAP